MRACVGGGAWAQVYACVRLCTGWHSCVPCTSGAYTCTLVCVSVHAYCSQRAVRTGKLKHIDLNKYAKTPTQMRISMRRRHCPYRICMHQNTCWQNRPVLAHICQRLVEGHAFRFHQVGTDAAHTATDLIHISCIGILHVRVIIACTRARKEHKHHSSPPPNNAPAPRRSSGLWL